MLAGILLWIVKYVQKCVWGDYNNFLNGQAYKTRDLYAESDKIEEK